MPDPPIDDPNPSDPNAEVPDYSLIEIKSLKDIFVKSTDIKMFFALFWLNWWVIFVWF
jgi:hypothetical protein